MIGAGLDQICRNAGFESIVLSVMHKRVVQSSRFDGEETRNTNRIERSVVATSATWHFCPSRNSKNLRHIGESFLTFLNRRLHHWLHLGEDDVATLVVSAAVIHEDRTDIIEFVLVHFHVGSRTKDPLFLA